VGNPTLATVGAALFLGGIFVTPLAWIMFAKSKTSFDLKENAPIGPAIATAPKPGGGQLAMTWSF